MKKILLGLGVVALLSTTSVQAQNEKGQMAISVGAGQSLLGSIYNSAEFENVKVIPVINGMFDFAVSDVVSMGIGLSYQSISTDVNSFYLDPTTNTYIDETVTESLNKLNVGVRMNFHYARGIDGLDMFSGFRLGYTNWGVSSTSSDPNYVESVSFNMPFALQLVPVAVRYYFTDMIGIHLETGIIGPYMIAGGISLKM